MLLLHQKYLESQEAAKRASNIIMTGVSEQDMQIGDNLYENDEDKVKRVLDEINQGTVEVRECTRLGVPKTTHARPLKVTLKNGQDRAAILANSNELKDKGEPLKNVYIKKDVHPMVRKEFARLRRVEKEEKQRPENEGRTVKYDPETRTVTVDGSVIDKFRPSFL